MWRVWTSVCLALLLSGAALAETVRIATFNASLTRSGAGLLLRAIEKGDDQVVAVSEIIQSVAPDVILINEFDYDIDARAARAFLDLLGEGANGISYSSFYAGRPNTGFQSGFDLNGDGKSGGPDDAFGYGAFPGQYGMLLASRFPIEVEAIRTFEDVLWSDLPGATQPLNPDGSPFPNAQAAGAMRFSSKSHWDVPIRIDGHTLHIFASHPTPPVFDGPEDRNGLRNAAEIGFWSDYIDGVFEGSGTSFPAPFVILGDLNADPADGDGRLDVIQALLKHPRLTDVAPQSRGGVEAAAQQRGANLEHQTDPALDTTDWNDGRGPGNLRVDYVLPSRDLKVVGSGVFWPTTDDPAHRLIGSGKPVSSDHRLVWVDIDF